MLPKSLGKHRRSRRRRHACAPPTKRDAIPNQAPLNYELWLRWVSSSGNSCTKKRTRSMMCVHLSASTLATCTHLPDLPVSMRRYFSGLCMRQRDKHKKNRHAGWHRYIRNINNHNKSEHHPPDLRTTRRHGCQQMPFPTRLCELALPMCALMAHAVPQFGPKLPCARIC